MGDRMPLGIRWRGLRTKIIAWSFIPTAIILMAVAWVTFVAYQRVAEDLVIERNQKLTRLAASEFASSLTEYTGLLTEYAGLLAGLPPIAYAYEGDLIVQQDVLERASGRLEVFDGGVIILSHRGVVVAAEPERPEILGQNWANRSYFQRIQRSPRPVFSDIVPDGLDGTEVVIIAVPIRGDKNQFQGVMAGLFRVGWIGESAFYQDLERLRLGEEGSAYLVDGRGRVIYHTEPDQVGGDFSNRAVVQRVLRQGTGALYTRTLEGKEIVASFDRMSGSSWGFVTEESWVTLMRSMQGYRQFLILLLILGVVVPALFVSVGVRRITEPITELIGAAQEVAEGNFGRVITTQTGDEIEALSEQFNLMSGQLAETYARMEQQVADRTRELAALNTIAVAVSQSLNLEETLEDALEETLHVIGIEAGGIHLLDETAGGLNLVAQRGFSPRLVAEMDGLKVEASFSGRVMRAGEPLIVPDVAADDQLGSVTAWDQGLRSLVVVPLSAKGMVLGTLFVATGGYREFTDQDVQLLTSIGHQIGIAVENARLFGQAEQRMRELETLARENAQLFEAEQRRAEQFRVINEVGRQITSILAVDELLNRMARLIKEAFGYYHVGFGLVEGDEVFSRAEVGPLGGEYRFDRLDVDQTSAWGWVVERGEPLLISDVDQQPRFSAAFQTTGIRSQLCVPLKTKEVVIGVLSVESDQPHAFDESDLAVLQSLAHQAAIAVENARLYERAQQLAVMEERNRLARDLHDAVTQTLFSASLVAETLPTLWECDQEEGRHLLGEIRRLSRGALAEMRTLLMELRPAALAEASLEGLLNQLAEAATGRTGIPIAVTVEGQCDLPSEVHAALYRIAQEGLNNVVKHARASQAMMHLCCTDLASSVQPLPKGRGSHVQVTLCISDDGRGFDLDTVPPERLGLSIMRERMQAIGGALEIDSRLGGGTRVRVVWPDPRSRGEE